MGPMQYIGAGLALAVAFLSMYVMILRGDIKVFEEREKNWQTQLDTLNGVIDGHESREAVNNTLRLASMKQTQDLIDGIAAEREITDQLQEKYNALRITEERNAQIDPYGRADAASERIGYILQRFTPDSAIHSPADGRPAATNDSSAPEGTDSNGAENADVDNGGQRR